MQRRMRWTLLVLVFVAPAASGWNDTGHMVAALIAYDRMPSSVSVAMGRLLHSHPRFQEDFVPRLPKRCGTSPQPSRIVGTLHTPRPGRTLRVGSTTCAARRHATR